MMRRATAAEAAVVRLRKERRDVGAVPMEHLVADSLQQFLPSVLSYHFLVDGLSAVLLKRIRKHGFMGPGDRVGVAVSGGADSVALLMLLLELRAELGIVLSVVHVNHKLRGHESDGDETFVAGLARAHDVPFLVAACPLKNPLAGMEAAARKLRYEFFGRLATEGQITTIATAHTLDDQAETVLLRMLRGTGIRGLAGIHRRMILDGGGEVVRPLLEVGRAEVEAFLRERGQAWREDSSNRDTALLRNRVRHRVLPLLKAECGDAAVANLADLAEIARAEEEHWQIAHPEIRDEFTLAQFAAKDLASQRRLIQEWLHENSVATSFRWIDLVRDLALGPAGKTLELQAGMRARRTQHELLIEPARPDSADYQYRLPIPGSVDVAQLGLRVEAVLVERESAPLDPGLLDPAKLPSALVVRNWRPGDRFWPAHTRSEKKIKDLLNDRHIVGAAKASWTVAVTDDGSIVWVRGFAVPVALQAARGAPGVWIRVVDKLD